MFRVVIDREDTKRVRVEPKAWSVVHSAKQHCTTSLEIEHPEAVAEDTPPKAIESDASSDSDAESEEDTLFWTPEISPSEFQQKFVNRTPEEVIAEMQAPQRSQLWLEARKMCITASQFGTAVGLNPQSKPEQMLIEKLWVPFQGNEATAWGTLHEPCAAASFLEWTQQAFLKESHLRIDIREQGLLKHHNCPWIGVSPDGILQVINEMSKQVSWQVLEYKCPYYAKEKADGSHPQSKWRDNIPDQYRAQIVGVSGYLSQYPAHLMQDESCKDCRSWTGYQVDKNPSGAFFVVWTPTKTFVTEVPFESGQWTSLYPQLKNFQFQMMLPALTHKHNGRLQENSLIATETMHLSESMQSFVCVHLLVSF